LRILCFMNILCAVGFLFVSFNIYTIYSPRRSLLLCRTGLLGMSTSLGCKTALHRAWVLRRLPHLEGKLLNSGGSARLNYSLATIYTSLFFTFLAVCCSCHGWLRGPKTFWKRQNMLHVLLSRRRKPRMTCLNLIQHVNFTTMCNRFEKIIMKTWSAVWWKSDREPWPSTSLTGFVLFLVTVVLVKLLYMTGITSTPPLTVNHAVNLNVLLKTRTQK